MISSPLSSLPLPFSSLAVVLNPQAGRGLTLREWPRLEAVLNARGLPWSWLSAASAEDALSRVQALPLDTAVLAVGGDGTVNRLLPAFVNTGRMLGLVPLGTGNDFAGMLGLKSGEFDGALTRLSRPPRAADVLRCTYLDGQTECQEWLLNGLGMGFDAQVAALLLKTPAQLPGLGRYMWAALSAVRQLKTEQVSIELDNQVLYTGPSCLVAVMNGTRYGGGFMISPKSDAFDGQLNVVLSTQLSSPKLLALMLRVLRASHLSDVNVRSGSGQSVTVRWQSPVVAHLDGEVIGPHRQISVELMAGTVQLLSAPL